MNTQPKNKILIIIIGILLIANIATLSFFLMNKKERPGRADRKAQVTSFLKNDVGFTQSQLDNYDTLSQANRDQLKTIFDDMATSREAVFKKLASQQFSDSGIDIAAKAMADQQKIFEIKMLRHLKDIRNICTPAQQAVFDTGFYKAIVKRGDGKKDNKGKQ